MSRFSLVAAVLIAAASGVLVSCSAVTSDGGPLRSPPPHGWATTQPVGETFGDGLEVLYLRGDQSGVIESVTVTGDAALELVGVRLATPDRTVASAQLLPWPPTSPDMPHIVPAIGATITPITEHPNGWVLLLGMRATKPGYHVRDGVRIEYRVGDQRFVRELDAELAVCTSTDLEVNGVCPFPDDRPAR